MVGAIAVMLYLHRHLLTYCGVNFEQKYCYHSIFQLFHCIFRQAIIGDKATNFLYFCLSDLTCLRLLPYVVRQPH